MQRQASAGLRRRVCMKDSPCCEFNIQPDPHTLTSQVEDLLIICKRNSVFPSLLPLSLSHLQEISFSRRTQSPRTNSQQNNPKQNSDTGMKHLQDFSWDRTPASDWIHRENVQYAIFFTRREQTRGWLMMRDEVCLRRVVGVKLPKSGTASQIFPEEC